MIKTITKLFFPEACAGCNGFLLQDEIVICTSCRHEIPLTNHLNQVSNEAFLKFYGRIQLNHVSTLFYFHKKGIVQELIHKLKYKGHQEIGTAIANWYAAEIKKSNNLQDVDVIIPVPLHPKRFQERGYNQVTTFAQSLAQELNCEYHENLLKRIVYSKSQISKNIEGRSISQQIFEVTFEEKHHNNHFLLVDDVLTTGATIEQCARELAKIPNSKISVICMAFSHG